MGIQTPEPERSKATPTVVLGVVLLIALVLATNWRALVLVMVILAAAAGWWLAK